MFRNFVKPAAFEKDGMRDGQGEPEGICRQIIQETEAEGEVVGQGDFITVHGAQNGICKVDAGGVQSNNPSAERSNGSLSRKGGYTTSIHVSGISPQAKRPKSASESYNQNHEQETDYSHLNGSSHNNSQCRSLPSSQRSHNIQARLSDISVTDDSLKRTVNGRSVSYVDNTLSRNSANDRKVGGATAGVIDDDSHITPTGIKDGEDAGGIHQGENKISEVSHQIIHAQNSSRSPSYSYIKFNIIPPPPPLVDPVFAGRRDVRDPTSIHERQIVSAKGTVRGFKNRVRAGIATFWAQPEDERNYRQLEQGKIVIYATSMNVVRDTNDRCKVVRRLLQNHMVRYEERDLYMSREIQQELKFRLAHKGIHEIRLPHVFADGIHIGGAEELEKLNEAGELRGLLNNYQKITVRIMCEKCGGYRYIPCEVCHGSKRSLLRNHFTEEFCALRCMNCDENGLRRCDLCRDQQE